MAACPNCGRRTLRTKDWACQWCGYPLISRAYKKIDKTFKELQEERSLALSSDESEEETEFEPEYEPEPEPEPEPRPRPRPPVRPVSRPRPEPEPQPEPRPAPRPAPEPIQRQIPPVQPVPPPRPEPAPQPVQPVIPLPAPRTEYTPPPPPQPEAATMPVPLITPPPAPRPVPPPTPKPEIIIEPEPVLEATIKLEAIQDGTEITADQIDALFKTEKAGANSRFTGKTLVIRGIVEKVFVREHLDIRYIVLTGSRKRTTWSLRCTFNKDESSKLTRLQEGQEVVVRGKYDGYSKNIIFKDCALV